MRYTENQITEKEVNRTKYPSPIFFLIGYSLWTSTDFLTCLSDYQNESEREVVTNKEQLNRNRPQVSCASNAFFDGKGVASVGGGGAAGFATGGAAGFATGAAGVGPVRVGPVAPVKVGAFFWRILITT
jgi:hypothetical protein